MRITKTSLFLLGWLVVLMVSPLVTHAASPYAGNQGSSTRPTTVPTAPPVTPVSKPPPVQGTFKSNVGAKESQK